MRTLAAHVCNFHCNGVSDLALNRSVPRIHQRQDLLGGTDVHAGHLAAKSVERNYAVIRNCGESCRDRSVVQKEYRNLIRRQPLD